MVYLDHSAQVTGVVLAIVFGAGVVIALGVTLIQHNTKLKAIDVLKVYAAKGEEPPTSVLETVSQIGRSYAGPPPPPPTPTRGHHLTHVAGSIVLALGAGGIAWWRAPEPHVQPEPLMVVALIAAIFFAGAAAARLVAALTTPGDGRR